MERSIRPKEFSVRAPILRSKAQSNPIETVIVWFIDFFYCVIQLIATVLKKRPRMSQNMVPLEFFSVEENFSAAAKWDAFMSFSGVDARSRFSNFLYKELKRNCVEVFRDREGIKRGSSISPQLVQAIEDSSSAIVIISQNYVKSEWCLDELQKILECQKSGQKVLPIFYNLEPSDLRKAKVRGSKIEQALATHKRRFGERKVREWADALVKVANLGGWPTINYDYESDVIDEVIEGLLDHLTSQLPSYRKTFVGIVPKMVEITSRLDLGFGAVGFLGMWGKANSGKTTLAALVYQRISRHFEKCCFLQCTGVTDVVCLQRELLSRLGIEDRVRNLYEGTQKIRIHLSKSKVLLVLDDINQMSQLDNLAGKSDWFGAGSRVIITTRYKSLLISRGVGEIYEVKDWRRVASHKLLTNRPK